MVCQQFHVWMQCCNFLCLETLLCLLYSTLNPAACVYAHFPFPCLYLLSSHLPSSKKLQ